MLVRALTRSSLNHCAEKSLFPLVTGSGEMVLTLVFRKMKIGGCYSLISHFHFSFSLSISFLIMLVFYLS